METSVQTTLKASELRLGNWVNIIDRVPIVITSAHFLSIEKGFTTYLPIPLTPELLEKCGFYTHEGCMFEKSYGNGYSFILYVDDKEIVQQLPDTNPVMSIGETYFNTYNAVGVPLKYLHELQNRFYSFTGEELKIAL